MLKLTMFMDFIALFVTSYFTFIIAKRLVDDGIIKKIFLCFLMLNFMALSSNYTMKKMKFMWNWSSSHAFI